ncbi:MAG: response regulator [Chloroflexota bacterium]
MKKILVIEDQPELLEEIVDLFEIEGYTVVSADNGLDGVQRALEEAPDLVVCDIMMPKLDGYGVLNQLREHDTTAFTPFIFLTAHIGHQAYRQSMELGADDYIPKPFGYDELLTAVRRQLEKSHKLRTHYEHRVQELQDFVLKTLPHELKTPLTAILGFSEILIDGYEDLQASQIQWVSSNITKAATRLQRHMDNYMLVNRLLVAQPDTMLYFGRMADPQTALITAAQKLAQAHEREEDLRLSTESIDPNMLDIHADALQKVMEELLGNAFKFSMHGSPIVVKAFESSANTYTIHLSDLGQGMNEGQLEQIGLFTQFDRQTFEQQGSGLGLYIAQALVAHYKGEFTIESQPGRGTDIRIVLPIAGECDGVMV